MKRTLICALVWLFVLPAYSAPETLQPDPVPYWIESILIVKDVPQRSLSYRTPTGDVQSVRVGSDAALKRLASLNPGQPVRLRCRSLDSGQIVVDEIQKAGGGHNWWKWGVLATLALVLIGLVTVGAPTGLPSD
jgi:hypothetical protein